MAGGTLILAVLCLVISSDLCNSASVQNRAQCRRLPFTSSPRITMYPRKGEVLVQQGWTLQREAARSPVLKHTLDFASRSKKYRESVEPYGRSMGLDGNESIAVFSYTVGNLVPPLYQAFNDALRRGDDSLFPVFHYFLDSAVRKLVRVQGSQRDYNYRGNSIYFTFRENTVTFPGFTSTSHDAAVARDGFWSEGCTMMKIKTHFGADITKLSNFTKEKEVLIPPFERFQVKGYSQENGIPTVTLETQEPFVTGSGNGATGTDAVKCYIVVIFTLSLYIIGL